MRTPGRWRRPGRVLSAVGAVVVSALLLGILGFGYGTIPALGPALDPGRGAWTSAYDGTPVTSQALHVPGLAKPVTVSFTKDGLASINAGDDNDLFLALGYVQAKYRLSEMDLERRLGEGQLAQLGGPSDLASDEFELRLGLLRTAQNEWAQTTGTARQALLAYAQGVNDDIAAGPGRRRLARGVHADRRLPQALDPGRQPGHPGRADPGARLHDRPARLRDPAALARRGEHQRLVPDRAREHPDALRHRPLRQGTAHAGRGGPRQQRPGRAAADRDRPRTASTGPRRAARTVQATTTAVTEAAGQLLDQLGQLPADQIHEYPDSNAWAVNGTKVDGGGALLGGDPHLPQTLPSIWYEVALSAPGYQVAGASLPGVPGVLLGHNAHIAWSLTDTQNSATLYYAEQVRGDEYYWRGAWRKMTVEHYTIPVRGGATVHLAVDITVHGPIMTQVGQRMAVDWMGNVPSDDLGALIGINQASDWAQFKAALAGWRAPTQNFTYADNDPVTGSRGGRPGTSASTRPATTRRCQAAASRGCRCQAPAQCDIDGVIPYNAIPQVYDPPSHVVATDNQRPVAADYPYYVGTSYDFYDPGYRAAHAYQTLGSASQLSAAAIAGLQNNLTDPLAAQMRAEAAGRAGLGQPHPDRARGGFRSELVELLHERRIGRRRRSGGRSGPTT